MKSLQAPRLSHKDACPGCDRQIGGREDISKWAIAHVVDVQGLCRFEHVPLRCRRQHCIHKDKWLWNNFVSMDRGVFKWIMPDTVLPEVIMLNPRFGVTLRWYRQFSLRLQKQQTSFKGEAEVMHVAGFAVSACLSFWKHLVCVVMRDMR
jgi:hypothetical protein